jgi:ABC-type enterochelin transport system substrate-binding protein
MRDRQIVECARTFLTLSETILRTHTRNIAEPGKLHIRSADGRKREISKRSTHIVPLQVAACDNLAKLGLVASREI